jgi:Carboxypeptidase regulatory-like domain
MTSSKLQTLLFSVVLFLTTSLSLRGQSTFGTVDGTVVDPSGAAVADAKVTLTNTGTQEKRTQATGSEGLYQFVNVTPGEYRLDIEKPGFKHYKHENVVVQVQQDSHIDAALAVGQATEVVEVTAETPLLQAETSSLGQVVEERKANELPLNGRNIFNLVSIAPSVITQGGAGGTPVGQNPFTWGDYQIGGSFGNQGAQYLDGQPLNIGYINLPILIPTQDSIGEFKVQYNDLGAEWGKFSGGIINLSTKSGSNQFHGEAYEFLRNKKFNSNDYFDKESELAAGLPNTTPPFVQNQYGFNIGGPVIKDKTFFFFSFEQFRLRQGNVYTTTVPTVLEQTGNFSELCKGTFTAVDPQGSGIPICSDTATVNGVTYPTDQIYDPYTVQANGNRTPYRGNVIPANEINFNPATATLLGLYGQPTTTGTVNNFTAASSGGGNTNQVDFRVDQNINSKSRIFGRFNYNGLLDLAQNPFGTGLCADRCAENYHTKAAVIDYNRSLTSTTILDLNFSASRFIYARAPINSGFDLTKIGWPASYNAAVPSAARTPPTPCISEDTLVSCSQGQSFIQDFNTQFNFSPSVTMIRGRHSIQFGGQLEEGFDNYSQTNIASGFFGFSNAWTQNNPLTPYPSPGNGEPIADLLLGLGQGESQSVGNQTSGVAEVPALTAGKQTYRALFVNDTFHATTKLTLNLGLRYELQGTWSERFDRLTYWNGSATNATVSGCSGAADSTCPGDIFLVGNGVNTSRNNLPLDKKEFSPRLGFAYGLDSKTVIRGGYGVFWIPNFVSFGANPDNDIINLATTAYVPSTDGGLTPASTVNFSGCSLTPGSGAGGFAAFSASCTPGQGPYGATGIVPPPGRGVNASAFAAGQSLNQIAAYTNPKEGYVEQWNLDIQRQLPGGFFADVAYAGSHGVHLQQYATQIDQIPDADLTQQAALVAQVPNTLNGITSGGLSPSVAPTINAGQYLRPYPEYTGVSLAGYGCCESIYHSLQATVQKHFQGGGTLLAAYTNAKLISNTDTLTTWLETDTGGVGSVQDWNNLKGERSLSSQDIPQRLVISYVLDLPFGHGRKFLAGATGAADKVVGGWGIDGVTTFQRGFPLKISYGGSTPLSSANLGVGKLRPNVVPGCDKNAPSNGLQAKLGEWFNTACFTAPADWGFGDEPRVDATLRMDGIDNFDFAIFKRTKFGPDNRLGLEFRTEFFDLFNHPQFGAPGTSLGTSTFGIVNSQINPPRQIQFALKFLF